MCTRFQPGGRRLEAQCGVLGVSDLEEQPWTQQASVSPKCGSKAPALTVTPRIVTSHGLGMGNSVLNSWETLLVSSR